MSTSCIINRSPAWCPPETAPAPPPVLSLDKTGEMLTLLQQQQQQNKHNVVSMDQEHEQQMIVQKICAWMAEAIPRDILQQFVCGLHPLTWLSGPMNSGKTTKVIEQARKAIANGIRVLCLCYDLRETAAQTDRDLEKVSFGMLRSRPRQTIECWFVKKFQTGSRPAAETTQPPPTVALAAAATTNGQSASGAESRYGGTMDLLEDMRPQIVFIDEAQFFGNLLEFCLFLVERGVTVVLSGLNGNYAKSCFPSVAALFSMANVVTLSGECMTKGCTLPNITSSKQSHRINGLDYGEPTSTTPGDGRVVDSFVPQPGCVAPATAGTQGSSNTTTTTTASNAMRCSGCAGDPQSGSSRVEWFRNNSLHQHHQQQQKETDLRKCAPHKTNSTETVVSFYCAACADALESRADLCPIGRLRSNVADEELEKDGIEPETYEAYCLMCSMRLGLIRKQLLFK